MNPIDFEIEKIKDTVGEMISQVKSQLERSKEAFLNSDIDLANQILFIEGRVNSLELSIDKYCENTIARFCPVATDLRFILSMLKIGSELERIGDYSASIAAFTEEVNQKFPKELIEKIRIEEMFDLAIKMMDMIESGFNEEDSKKMKKLFSKDKELNAIDRNKTVVITNWFKEHPEDMAMVMFIHTTIKKLERVGDHAKNIAENYIFYSNAKVLKHKK